MLFDSKTKQGYWQHVIKVIAIGDVHGMWAEAWRALKLANAATNLCLPTQAVLDGRFQIILTGDLVHYKDYESYDNAVGERFDPYNKKHLKRAAKAQIREMYRFKDYFDKSNGNVRVILGNHDEDALTHDYGLVTRGGVEHNEFNPDEGGIPIPDDLKAWFLEMPREITIHGVHFAHAGPLPSMQFFDDFFYNDRDTKHWWHEKPFLLEQAKHRFGVYGHTMMEEGIHIDKEHNFAMIDALPHRQYFEMILSEERLDYRAMKF